MREIVRAVEIAQQKVRKPPSSPPPRNSLQKSRVPAPPDPLKPIADELVGKSGSIAVGVGDVFDNRRTTVWGAPPGVAASRLSYPYLVLAECENPTATYLPDEQQRDLRRARDLGFDHVGARARERAANSKPPHPIWILSDDEAVQEWARGSRHYPHAEIVSASLGRVLTHEYVKAVTLVKMQPKPTVPATQRAD